MSQQSGFLPGPDQPQHLFRPPVPDGALASPSGNSGTGQPLRDPLPFTSGGRLTVSFAPDGTKVSRYTSSLYATFGHMLAAPALEAWILAAFQQWAKEANLNVGIVADGGQAFGTSGPNQGDPRFGDIRIGAVPMDPSVYAVAVRNDALMSGTWGGDILFNANAVFTSPAQIYAVALHEIGHALGLKHSGNPASVMYAGRLNSALISQDVAAIRGLYGARNMDRMEKPNDPNDSLAKASRIENPGSLQGRCPLVVYGDLPASGDVDWYELPALSNYGGPVSFELVTSGISLLRARLTVVDEDGRLVGTQQIGGARGGRVKVTVPAAPPGVKHYARVEAVDQSLYSTGSYALIATHDGRVSFSSAYISQVARGNYWNLKQSDVRKVFLEHQQYFFEAETGANDTFDLADRLKTTPGFAASRHYQLHGSLSQLSDVDFLVARVPSDLAAGSVFTVAIDMMERGRLVPTLSVFNAARQEMTSQVVVNANGSLVVQVGGITPGQDVFIRASAEMPGDSTDRGNYTLTARFDALPVAMAVLGTGTVLPAQQKRFHGLYVAEPQLMRFSLAASSGMTRAQGQVWMTVFDKLGRVVYRALTVPGQTRTAQNVLLRPGSYSIMVSLAASADAPAGGLDYVIRGESVTDPIGPELLPPGEKPFGKQQGQTNYNYPGGISSPNTFIVVPGNVVSTPGSQTAPPQVDPNRWYWYANWLTPEVPPNL